MTRFPRILMLAFSGVRVVDPDIARLGMTLPGFAERARRIAALPSLGLLTLAARTPEDVEVVYRERDELPADAERWIANEGFLFVAISSTTASVLEAYALADRVRSAGVPVVLGGLHASAEPDEASCHADAVVEGEGESVWATIVQDARAGTLKTRYAAPSAPLAALDAGPPPRFDLLRSERYDRFTVQTMRGCPLDCRFCGASRTIAPYRRRGLALVERDLEHALRFAPTNRLELADDNTFADTERGRALAQLLAASGARWFTETDASVADDPELVDVLAASGCAGLLIGFESASTASLRESDTRGWKSEGQALARDRIRTLQAAGVPVTGCFVLGFDGDDPDVFQRTIDYVDTLDLAEVQFTLLTPFPGTRLRADLAEQGRLGSDARDWSRLTLFDVAYEPSRMSRDDLREGFRALLSVSFAPVRVARRAGTRRACLREAARRRRDAR